MLDSMRRCEIKTIQTRLYNFCVTHKSSFGQLMACCVTKLSYYRYLCWLMIDTLYFLWIGIRQDHAYWWSGDSSSHETWWRHQMETFSALLAICAGNSPVPGEFPSRGSVNSPHKRQWRGALIFSLICVWINGWVDNRETGDLRRYRAHYDVTVMNQQSWYQHSSFRSQPQHQNKFTEWFMVYKFLWYMRYGCSYFSNPACDWLSIVWAYSEQETENGPWSEQDSKGLQFFDAVILLLLPHLGNWRHFSIDEKYKYLFVFPQNNQHIKVRADTMIIGKGRYSVCPSNGTRNTLRPRQNGRHFPDDTFKRIFLNEYELTKITAKSNNGFKKTVSNENLQHLTIFFIGSGFVGSISQR